MEFQNYITNSYMANERINPYLNWKENPSPIQQHVADLQLYTAIRY